MIHKKHFRLNDSVSFDLGNDYLVLDDVNGDGDRVIMLVKDPYIDDKGDTAYRFRAKISLDESDGNNSFVDIGCPMGTSLMDDMQKNTPGARFYRIKTQPAAQFIAVKMPLNIGNCVIKLYGLSIQVPFTSNRSARFVFINTYSYDEKENLSHYQELLDAAKTFLVHGKPLDLRSVSAELLMRKLTPNFDEEQDPSGIGSDEELDDEEYEIEEDDDSDEDESEDSIVTLLNRIRQLNDEIDKVRGMLSDNIEESEMDYPTIDPDEHLYSHYAMLKKRQEEAGRFMIINSLGTDFQPLDLLEIMESIGGELTKFRSIIEAYDKGFSDKLVKSALKMANVFRVNRSAFNDKHDREAAIIEGMFEKKYMLSALRSFAWTLAEKACIDERDISSYNFDELFSLGEFIKEREWLNYEESSWFDGLCGHPDVHVVYVPQEIIDNEIDSLFSRMMNNKPVCSLDALREDLSALEDVMAVIHNGLLEGRDRNKPLEGVLADVLTAWCALCVASRKPFFSEDGPRAYYYAYPKTPLNTEAVSIPLGNPENQERTERAENESHPVTDHIKTDLSSDSEEWMEKYGEHVTSNPQIQFDGKLFVFTGFGSSSDLDDPLVQAVLAKGGQHRKSISGKTDYLVVDPERAGEAKSRQAVERIEQGCKIKIVLRKDVEAALGRKGSVPDTPQQLILTTDLVDTDLYIILNNENSFGKLNRSDEEFYECYAEDFPGCSKTELLRKRRSILNKSKDGFRIPENHIEEFMGRPVADRCGLSTMNFFIVDDSEINFAKKAEKAIECTKDFYTTAELKEVHRLMDQKLRDLRAEIDRQYDVLESSWKHYSGARNHIKVYIEDLDSSERDADCVFQQEQDNALVTIKMAKPGMSLVFARLINCMVWYWNVTSQQIWEQALKNGVEDLRSYPTGNAVDIAHKAFHNLFPEVAAAAEREKVAQLRAKEEAEIKERREQIQRLERKIRELEYNRDNLRGLFARLKKKKLQAQIDKLHREVNLLKR